MAYLIGITLAAAIGAFGSLVRLDRDRAFYPTVLIVIALLYVLFAAMAGPPGVVALELVPAAAFIVAAALGFRQSLWLVVGGLVAHGLFDAIHGRLIRNEGVPIWWPGFCLGYDVVAGLYLGWLLSSRRVAARAG